MDFQMLGSFHQDFGVLRLICHGSLNPIRHRILEGYFEALVSTPHAIGQSKSEPVNTLSV